MKRSWIWIVLFLFATSVYAASTNTQFEKGKEAFGQGEYAKAVTIFRKLTESDPQQGDYFAFLGAAYCKSGQFWEAVAACQQSLKLPHAKDLEELSWAILASANSELGRLDAAISSKKKSIELDPNSSSNFADLSKLCNDNQQYDEAITAAKRAIELKPDNDLAYDQLGNAYLKKKQYDESSAALKKAIQIDPTCASYHVHMGELFGEIGDYYESIKAFVKADELQPNQTNVLRWIAFTYRLVGKYDDAIAAFTKIIAMQTYTGTGIVLAMVSGHPEVKEVMDSSPAKRAGIQAGDEIKEINGKSVKGWNIEKTSQFLGGVSGTQVVLTIGRQGAIKSIEKTVTGESFLLIGAASYYGGRSIAYRNKGSLEAALLDAEKAYSLNQADVWARRSLGTAYLDRGQYDEAIKLLSQHKGLSDRILEATAYAKQGKMKEAVDIYVSIPEGLISPKNVPLMYDRLALLQLFTPLVKEHRNKAGSLETRGLHKEALSELSEALMVADEAEAQAIRESIFSMVRRTPSLAEMPEEAREHALRGEMLVKEGSFEKAAEEFKQAIRIAPYAARLYYNSALIHAELKKYSEAIRQMGIYLQAAPDAPDARAAKDEIIKWKFMMEKEK